MLELFFVLALFQLKHFLADYPLQRPFMLKKFSEKPDEWIPALTAHAGVHFLFTFCIMMWLTGNFYVSAGLGLFDFSVHFVMDRIKASPRLLGRWKPDSPYFWWSLGFDQMIHHLTDLFVVFTLLSIYSQSTATI